MSRSEMLFWTCGIYGAVFVLAIGVTRLARGTGWGRNMTQAIASWFAIFALFIGAAFAGTWAMAALMLPIAVLAMREFYRHAGVCGRDALLPAGLLAGVAAGAAAAGHTTLFYATPAAAAMLLPLVRLFARPVDGFVKSAGLRLFGWLYWGWLPLFFVRICGLRDGFGAVVLLCSMIALNDNSAYYVGKLCGRNGRKMAPTISPNKTWVGFCGGSAATLLSAVIFGYGIPHVAWGWRLLAGLCMACAIPVGDLIESAMKRDLGIKDSGTLIPGHGGVMDRFDSWVFVAPLFYLLMRGAMS